MLVSKVLDSTPAEDAGVQVGDLIVAVGKEAITSFEDLHRALRKTRPKRSVTLTVQRGGKKLGLTATLKTMSLPLVMPPVMPPAWLVAVSCGARLPGAWSA